MTPLQRTQLEKNHYYAQMMFASIYMLSMHLAGIRSAYMFGSTVAFLLFGLLGHGLWTYALPLAAFVVVAEEAITSVSQLVLFFSFWLQWLNPDPRHLCTPDWPDGQRRTPRYHYGLSRIHLGSAYGPTNRTPLSSLVQAGAAARVVCLSGGDDCCDGGPRRTMVVPV